MKKLMVLSLAVSIGVVMIDSSAYAQRGRGPQTQVGRGRGLQGGRLGNSNTGLERDRGQSAENSNRYHDRQSPASISDRLESNPKLAERVRELLPTGITLQTASDGFKNQGQFIAALHVSKNLRIPFADLKAKMTGDNAVSLGEAIQELRPELGEEKAREEAERAEQEANKTEALPKTT